MCIHNIIKKNFMEYFQLGNPVKNKVIHNDLYLSFSRFFYIF